MTTTTDNVQAAVEALKAFGDRLDRATATTLLPMWSGYGQLTDAERAAVIARFPNRRR